MKKKRACIVTLGCAKNLVDSEVLAGSLAQRGYELVTEVGEAELAVVNTCGFLQAAVKEGIDTILEVCSFKQRSSLARVIVTGCMVARYGKELRSSLPEVDLFVAGRDLESALDGDGAASEPDKWSAALLYNHASPRVLSSGAGSAYVKISEGCDRACAFCTIPSIKGPYQGRSLGSIAAEVERLGAAGIKEVNLVAQDLTAYRGSAEEPSDLTTLLETLDRDGAVKWIRILYAYPTGVNQKLLEALRDLPRVCEYLDLPLQHSEEGVLKAMRRPIGRFAARPMVERMRRVFPELHLRTTFLVGYPGESDKDFEALEQLVSEGQFDNVGVFAFSAEEGTEAAKFSGQIPQRVRTERRRRILAVQQQVVAQRLQALVGRRFPLLFEGPHGESDLLLVGRTRFQAPEVDGEVIINELPEPALTMKPGDLLEVEITASAGYDAVGRVVGVL